MAVRYSGLGTVRIAFDDRRGEYRAIVNDGQSNTTVVWVGTPSHLTKAVDSPEAYDEAAHAAISFALEDGFLNAGNFQTNNEGSGWLISRSKPAWTHRRKIAK